MEFLCEKIEWKVVHGNSKISSCQEEEMINKMSQDNRELIHVLPNFKYYFRKIRKFVQ